MPNASGGAWTLAADFAANPRRAMDRIAAAPRPALTDSLRILLAYMVASAVYYWLKPESFPPPPEGAVLPEDPRGLLFWTKVQLWTPALDGVLVATTAWFAQLLKGERLPRRLLAAVLCGAAPVLLLIVYAQSRIPGWAFAGGWLLFAGLAAPGFRRVPPETWAPLAAVLLGVNALSLFLVPLFTAAVLARWAVGYHALEMGLLFWTLGVSTYGAGRLLGLPAARAFCAVFLGLLAQIVFVFSMHTLGLLPNDVLKALMAV